jgi:hypothetical protein
MGRSIALLAIVVIRSQSPTGSRQEGSLFWQNSKDIRFIVTVLDLTILAAALRFDSLGVWPFCGDETAMFEEENVLFDGQNLSHDGQTYSVLHLIPVSCPHLRIDHIFFGLVERDTRALVVRGPRDWNAESRSPSALPRGL